MPVDLVAETGGQAGSAPIPVARRQDRGADRKARREGKIICLRDPDSVGGCLSMRKMRQFNHRARFAVSWQYFRQWVIGCSIIGLKGASRSSGRIRALSRIKAGPPRLKLTIDCV